MDEGKTPTRLKPNLLLKQLITQLTLRLMRLVFIVFFLLFHINKKQTSVRETREIMQFLTTNTFCRSWKREGLWSCQIFLQIQEEWQLATLSGCR